MLVNFAVIATSLCIMPIITLHLTWISTYICVKHLKQDKSKRLDVISCLNKNLIIHFVCYLEKGKRYEIEILLIETFLWKSHAEMCIKG